MATHNDDFDDIPSLVPERDELVTHHRKRKRIPAAAAATVVREVETRTSGGVIMLLVLLFIGMLATGGAGYYFYQQGLETQAQMENAQARLLQLENHLNLVNQAVDQSATDLVERVNFNFSEIDKLWAARNALRTEIGELTTGVTALKEGSAELETALGTQGGVLTQNSTLLGTLETRIEQINENFSGMSNLGEQLTRINADLNRVKVAMDALETDVAERLGTAEQDIESINVYRLQVNQSLDALQDSVNRLQQRVGQ